MAKAVSAKTAPVSVRLPLDLLAELTAEAAKDNRPLGSIVVERVRAAKGLIAALRSRIAELEQAIAEARAKRIPPGALVRSGPMRPPAEIIRTQDHPDSLLPTHLPVLTGANEPGRAVPKVKPSKGKRP